MSTSIIWLNLNIHNDILILSRIFYSLKCMLIKDDVRNNMDLLVAE